MVLGVQPLHSQAGQRKAEHLFGFLNVAVTSRAGDRSSAELLAIFCQVDLFNTFPTRGSRISVPFYGGSGDLRVRAEWCSSLFQKIMVAQC